MEGVILLKGDMVKYTAPEIFSSSILEYASPGVVMDVLDAENFFGSPMMRARVYWADGKVTTEHFCYLEKISTFSSDD